MRPTLSDIAPMANRDSTAKRTGVARRPTKSRVRPTWRIPRLYYSQTLSIDGRDYSQLLAYVQAMLRMGKGKCVIIQFLLNATPPPLSLTLGRPAPPSCRTLKRFLATTHLLT